MNTFLLSFDATTTITGSTPPRLEILVGGALVASIDMIAGATSYDVFVEYTGTAPSTLSVRFAGSSGSGGDSINFTAMDVNNTALNLGTDLTATMLMQSQISTITAAADLYGHTTPTLGAPTITGDGTDEELRGQDGVADIIDGMAGNDRVYGFSGDDEINGDAGADMLFGQAGADTILGGAGDDFIMGNEDNDILFGEGDNDTIIGGSGNDIINGGSGNDGLVGEDGDDVIFGEDGDDWLIGGAGQDILIGDDGNDFIVGGADNDALAGGVGNDQLIGGAGDDLMSGGDDDDELIGEGGNDTIDGDGGRDDIYGGDGDDVINGGDNDDRISGGADNDTIDGGSGVDSIIGGSGADTIDGGDGNDTIHAHGMDAETISDILFNNPNVVYNEDNGSFYQFVLGFANDGAGAEAAANTTTLNGVNGHLAVVTTAAELTYLDGIAAGDSYWLGGTDDVNEDVWLWNYGPEAGIQWAEAGGAAVNNFATLFAAGQPNDGVSGNLAYLWSASDGLADSPNAGFAHSVGYIVEWEAGLFSDDNAADILDGGAGNDWLYGYGGNDTINGGDDNDNIFAGTGDDVVNGDDGDDAIMANAGTDFVIGGAGADFIDGGDGADILHGHGLSADDIQTILDANPDVVYSSSTGSFYQFVNANVNHASALAAANAATLSGQAGSLVNITSAEENAFVSGIINDLSWTGGVDNTQDGTWTWNGGIDDGIRFSDVAGNAQNGLYESWDGGQPQDNAEYNLVLYTTGVWHDWPSTSTHSYVIEWEAGLINDDNAIDTINGGAGADIIYGYGGDDVLSGGADNDVIFGLSDDDTINGDAGNDILWGGAGIDVLNGGDDDDTLNGGAGNDTINGGAGTDTVDYSTSAGAVTVDLINQSATGDGSDTLSSIENANGSANDDILLGDGGVNVLNGGAGADEIRANEQTEIIVNAGTLLSYGGSQDAGGTINYMNDDVGVELDGNLWKKFLVNYTVTANTVIEFDFRSTNEAEISGIGFDNDDNIDQNATFKVYGDQNWGRTNFDNYDGSGNWTHYEIDVGSFYTGTFSHLILVNDDDGGGDDGEGYWRNIIIHEGNTDDNTINGGTGADDLYGGAEIDTFDFDNLSSVDNIHFFNENEDILDISDILTGAFSGTITDYLQFTNNGDHVTVAVDANGTAGGAAFTDIAEIRGAADLDESTLYTNGQILV